MPEPHRVRVHRHLGRPMLLVDGYVAATWKLIRAVAGTGTARIEISPFAALSLADTDAVLRAAEQLLAFAAPDAGDHDIALLA